MRGRVQGEEDGTLNSVNQTLQSIKKKMTKLLIAFTIINKTVVRTCEMLLLMDVISFDIGL